MFEVRQLDNGIRVVCNQVDGVRSFAIGIYVKACSNFERDCEIGVSHLIEHMMFKGTERHGAKQIAEIIDNTGGVMNAFTAKDCTAYYARVLTEHAPIAIDLLSDMLINSRFLEEDIAKELQVVKEEIAMYEDSPEDVAFELFQKVAYGDHPLAYPVLGYADALDQLSREVILQYLDRFYTVENTVISVAGNLPDDLFDMLNNAFADYRKGGTTVKLNAPVFKGGYQFVRKEIEQNHICVGFDGINFGHKDYYCYLLISNLFGGTASSMLFQKIRESEGLAYSIYSHPTFFKDAGHFSIYTSYRPQNQMQVAKGIRSCIDALPNYIDEAMLSKAKMQLKGSYVLGLESSTALMSSLGKRSIYGTELYSIDQIMDKIDAIGSDDVKHCIARLLKSEIALTMVGDLSEDEVKAVYRVFQ